MQKKHPGDRSVRIYNETIKALEDFRRLAIKTNESIGGISNVRFLETASFDSVFYLALQAASRDYQKTLSEKKTRVT